VKSRPWGVTTEKAGKIYVHLLDWPDQLLALPKLANVTKANLLTNGNAVEVRQVADGTILRLPEGRDPIDTIIVLTADERR
jgi:alpha-L-fucosidase